MSADDRKNLLAFMTGSARAPPKGLSAPEARIVIGRQGPDGDALPTAHTCFNFLLFPEYESKEKLKEKLDEDRQRFRDAYAEEEARREEFEEKCGELEQQNAALNEKLQGKIRVTSFNCCG